MFLTNRQLYNLCQMFPEAASESVRFVLRDAMHEMEGTIEAKGRATFPGLDVVSGARSPRAQACGCQEPGAVQHHRQRRGAERPSPPVAWGWSVR